MIPLNEEHFGTQPREDSCYTIACAAPAIRRNRSFGSRERRVVFVLLLIWGLSMLDLGLTVALTATSGMCESNPLARAMVNATGSAYSLAAWKIVWTAIGTVILLALRRRWKAEAAAWLCLAALGFTTLTWVRYLECEEIQALNGTVSHHNAPPQWMGGHNLREKVEEAAAPRSIGPSRTWQPEVGIADVQPVLGQSVRSGLATP